MYCVDLIKQSFEKNNYGLNIIFGDYKFKFPNSQRTFKIDIQYEHTLVKPGGRDSTNSITGSVKLNENSFYLVRIHNYNYFKKNDFTIDYSIPNILNIKRSEKFKKYLQQTTFVSPLLFEFTKELLSGIRNKNVITTFLNSGEPRRKSLLENLKKRDLR